MTEALATGAAAPALERHLEQDVRLWLGLPAGAAVEPPRLPARLARRLQRIEEHERSHRDQWGNFEFGSTESCRAGTLWIPEVDEWAAARRRELAAHVRLEPLWPDGHAFAVCSTHDVDMVSREVTPAQALRAVGAALGPIPDGRGDGPAGRIVRPLRALARAAYFGMSWTPATTESLERCLEVEQRLGLTGSYLFTVLPSRPTPYDCNYDAADRCRFRGRPTTVAAVARTVADDGFDVGLHGSYRSALDARILSDERERLEEMVGRAVRSTRQHYLHFDARLTPRVQEASRLRTDSTVGFNRNVGFRAGTSLPFHHFDLDEERGLDVLEIPLVVQDGALLAGNALELDGDLAREVVAQLIDAVAAVQGVATLLFHPHSLLDADLLALYRFSIEYAIEQGGWVTSLAEIDRWWRGRARRLMEDGAR